MGQWLIVDTLLRRAGACGSRPTQAVREAGTPCGRVGRIAPSKLLNLRAGLGIRRIGNQGRGTEGQRGKRGGKGRLEGGSWKESGRCKVQGARLSGMWNVECSVEGRRCWWKEKVGEQTRAGAQLSQPARPHQHHRVLVHTHLALNLPCKHSTVPKHVLAQTHINPQPHLSICQ